MKLKIASYNVRKAVGRDRRREPKRILHVLAEINADIVILQEADRRLGARPSAVPKSLIHAETDFIAADLAENDQSLGWHGNAILVRRGLKIRDAWRIALPGLEPRGAVGIDVNGLCIVGAHLGLLRLYRRKQMAAIMENVSSVASRTIVAGDFNEWSNARGYEPWQDRFDILFPGKSFPTIRPVAALDGFAVGNALHISDHGVVRSSLARIASDHFPVWASLKVPKH